MARLTEIQTVNRRVYRRDGNGDAYREAMDNIGRIYGSATQTAQTQFRNKYLQTSGGDRVQ